MNPKARRDRGSGTVWKRGALYWIAYVTPAGERRQESTGTDNRQLAVQFLRTRTGQAENGQLPSRAGQSLRFEGLAALLRSDYRLNSRRSLPRAERGIVHLREAFGADRAADISAARLSAYAAGRLDAGAAHSTVNTELALLNRMFTLAVSIGALVKGPKRPRITIRNTRTGFFEEAEFRAVLAELPPLLQGLIRVAYITGWRVRDELLSMTWRQVDFAAGEMLLEVGTTKNDEGRRFPIRALPELETALRAQRDYTDQVQRQVGAIVPWVFHRNGKPIRDFRKAWDTAFTRAGVARKIPHDFRRTAVRNLERAGVSRDVAKRLVGHKTDSIYSRYNIVNTSDLMAGVARLAAHHETMRKSVASEARYATVKQQSASASADNRLLIKPLTRKVAAG